MKILGLGVDIVIITRVDNIINDNNTDSNNYYDNYYHCYHYNHFVI